MKKHKRADIMPRSEVKFSTSSFKIFLVIAIRAESGHRIIYTLKVLASHTEKQLRGPVQSKHGFFHALYEAALKVMLVNFPDWEQQQQLNTQCRQQTWVGLS